jgi:hypothetical protein
MRMLLK